MKEKQIEEMFNIIVDGVIDGEDNNGVPTSNTCANIAEALYNAGYRKQSEGEWEKRTFIIFDSEKVGFRCLKCNTTWDAPTKFCPNCGAYMGDKNE